MKTGMKIKMVVLLTVLLTASLVFVGCQSMDNATHNTDDGRDGTSGHALLIRLNPSRIPSNSNSSLNAHIRFIELSDMSPVPNARVRLALEHPAGAFMEDKVAHFANKKLMTDVVTDAKGEANVTVYAGNLARWVSEVTFSLDAQSTIEYDKGNSLEYRAQEWFHIYNPHWDGTLPPNRNGPTPIINIFPLSGATLDTVVTFDGSGSYDTPGDLGAGIVAYDWYLGDGTFKRGKIVQHTYSSYDKFQITLRVTNRLGLVNQASAEFEIVDPDDGDDDEDPVPDYVVTGAGTFNVNSFYFMTTTISDGVYAYRHTGGLYWLYRVSFTAGAGDALASGRYWVIRTTLPGETENVNPADALYYASSSSAVPFEGVYQVGSQGIAPGARVARY